ncbi:hypothetical protein VUR80DRAFT_2624 [Thermomyces stellatus]
MTASQVIVILWRLVHDVPLSSQESLACLYTLGRGIPETGAYSRNLGRTIRGNYRLRFGLELSCRLHRTVSVVGPTYFFYHRILNSSLGRRRCTTHFGSTEGDNVPWPRVLLCCGRWLPVFVEIGHRGLCDRVVVSSRYDM